MSRSFISILILSLLAACQGGVNQPTGNKTIHVLAIESFLADIAQNVAGDRIRSGYINSCWR